MEFVAQLVERQFVALVVAGSKPVKLPNMVGSSRWPRMTDFHSVHTSSNLVPTAKCFNSTVVVQLTCNEQVVGSNPTKGSTITKINFHIKNGNYR